jgi:hypothetical protein
MTYTEIFLITLFFIGVYIFGYVHAYQYAKGEIIKAKREQLKCLRALVKSKEDLIKLFE